MPLVNAAASLYHEAKRPEMVIYVSKLTSRESGTPDCYIMGGSRAVVGPSLQSAGTGSSISCKSHTLLLLYLSNVLAAKISSMASRHLAAWHIMKQQVDI